MSNQNQLTQAGNQEVSIALNRDTFAQLILNFLGKKEKLSLKKRVDFVLNHNDIEQFYYLLNAKIDKEPSTSVEHFLVTLNYNDNTVRQISGIEALNAFLETRHVIPQSITLTWNIIVKYPNAPTVENQNIELTFITNNKENQTYEEGEVILSISHTNQAWAAEVLNLLRDKINGVTLSRPKALGWHEAYLFFFGKDMILMFLALCVMVGAMFSQETGSERAKAYYQVATAVTDSTNLRDTAIATMAVHVLDASHTRDTAEKLVKSEELKKSLIQVADEKEHKDSRRIWILVSILGLGLLLLFCRHYCAKSIKYFARESHILITSRAENLYKTQNEAKSKMEFFSLTLTAFTLATGLVVNIVWQLMA